MWGLTSRSSLEGANDEMWWCGGPPEYAYFGA